MDETTHVFDHLCKSFHDPKCPACVITELKVEIKRLKASLREAGSRNKSMRKKMRKVRKNGNQERVL